MSIRHSSIILLLAATLPLAPYFLVRAWRNRARGGKHFLVIPQLTRVGDLVASTPLFSAIKKTHPGSRIVLFVSKKAAGIVKRNPNIDEYIFFEDYKHDLLGLLRLVAHKRFSAGVSLSGTSLSTLLMLWGAIPQRIKLTRAPRPLGEALTDWLANQRFFFERGGNLGLFYLAMLKPIGITGPLPPREIYIDAVGEKKAEAFLAHSKIKQSDCIIGVALSAGNAIKEWGDERFSSLIAMLLKRQGTVVLLIAGPKDVERCGALVELLSHHPRLLIASDFTLEELPSLLKRLTLYISGDSGPLHVAAALEIPVIDIIGPVVYGELTPTGPHVNVVRGDPSIEPTVFSFHKAGPPAQSRRSLETTSVESVYRVAAEVLDSLWRTL